MTIEKSIQVDLLSGVVSCLDQIILGKRRFTTLEESDKFVKLSKELVEKYKDRIQKLIDKEEDKDTKKEAEELLKQVEEL